MYTSTRPHAAMRNTHWNYRAVQCSSSVARLQCIGNTKTKTMRNVTNTGYVVIGE